MNRLIVAGVVFWAIAFGSVAPGAEPRSAKSSPQHNLNEARRLGWEFALVVVERLEPSDPASFPGIRAFVRDVRKVEKGIDRKRPPSEWPAIDIDALVTRNPNFWRASYEVAPADPGWLGLHAGLLLSAGEAYRAQQVLGLARQGRGIPGPVRGALTELLARAGQVIQDGNTVVQAGVQRFDRGDRKAAVKTYREALAVWPQDAWAEYELGLAIMFQDEEAAGRQPPKLNTMTINGGHRLAPEVTEHYARARRHDPLQWRAYQGNGREFVPKLLALAKQGMPAWQTIAATAQPTVGDDVLVQFAEGCQKAGIDDLALVARQVVVSRRGRYQASDHPFIQASLRKLAPGPATEATLKRLAGSRLELRQIVPPEADAP